MTDQTRIFVDATSKTVIHAIETERTNRQGKEKHISSISRSQLKQGSRQQGRGDDVFNSLMEEGNFVEVDQDSLLVRKKFSDAELDKQTQHLAFVLGLSRTRHVNYLRNALALMEDGKFAHENVEACEAQPEPQEEPAPVKNEGKRAIIREVATEVIKEFDQQDIVDWKTRDSMVAKLRVTVRRRLKDKPGLFLSTAIAAVINDLLATEQQPA